MQDRFKFRVWHKKRKKMYDVLHFHTATWNNGGEWVTAKGFDIITQQDVHIQIEPKDGIIIQCTGLKDKNGKEIYDGDILNLYVSSKKLYRYQVKYEIGSFMLVSQDEIFDFPNVWNDYVYPLSQLYYEYQNEENFIDQCEVVGNIYENPELLENGVLA